MVDQFSRKHPEARIDNCEIESELVHPAVHQSRQRAGSSIKRVLHRMAPPDGLELSPCEPFRLAHPIPWKKEGSVRCGFILLDRPVSGDVAQIVQHARLEFDRVPIGIDYRMLQARAIEPILTR